MSGLLTKSSLAELEQCERRFWLSRHRPELAAAVDDAVFVDGHRVGALARTLLPNGVLIEEKEPEAALVRTKAVVGHGDRPVFEAAFEHQGVFVRTDLLVPGESGWLLAEVKSSSKPKNHHLTDLATQLWVARGSGLAIHRAVVRHIDNQFVYPGGGDYRGLFNDSDGGAPLDAALKARPSLAARALVLSKATDPQTPTGDHCQSPFACPFASYCTSGAPPVPDFPSTLLPGAKGKAAGRQLMDAGYIDLRSVPDGLLTDPEHLRILEATRNGKPHHDREMLIRAVAGWAGPRYYLDFETIGLVIPVWAGTRPFEALPFQFSCHVETEDGAVSHSEFLDLSGDDPGRACAEALIAALGVRGAIVTYNLPTERAGLKALAGRCPDLAPQLEAMIARLVDLLPLVKAHYYHPAMKGSYSIKAVLPAVVPELSYKDLEVQDGRAAQIAWLAASHPDVSPESKDRLREAMLRYCERDTWAMVALVRALADPRAPSP